MRLSKRSVIIKFDKLQKTKKGFCPGMHLRVKIPHKWANNASVNTYSEAHQKLGNQGEEMTGATAKKMG
jgi:hypothetical protein